MSGKEDPKAAEIIAASNKVVTATYERPFETHARMEPINATVHVQPDRVDVWAPTQDQSAAILLVADQLKVDPKTVYAHTMFLGGGFGGNGAGGTGVTRQAALISKEIGKPVMTTNQVSLWHALRITNAAPLSRHGRLMREHLNGPIEMRHAS